MRRFQYLLVLVLLAVPLVQLSAAAAGEAAAAEGGSHYDRMGWSR